MNQPFPRSDRSEPHEQEAGPVGPNRRCDGVLDGGRHGRQPGRLSSDNLGADDAVVAACDSNGDTSSYTNAYGASGTAGYKVDDVVIGGIADACDGEDISVTLTGAGGASLGSQTGVVPTGAGTSSTLSFAGSNVLAESVTGVHVVIAG